jgi:hypothetical protein
MKKFKFQFKLPKKDHITSQLIHHIASSTSSLTSYSLIQSMYQIPYESSQDFLAHFNINDHQHFFEHLSILNSNLWLKEQIAKQCFALVYPLIMFISSSVLFHVFQIQFKSILHHMKISTSLHSVGLTYLHILVFMISIGILFLLIWINKAMYRKVLTVQLLKKTALFKISKEWMFFVVVNSIKNQPFSFQSLISLMKAHEYNSIFSILSYELKEHIDDGENLNSWMNKISINPKLSIWLSDQIINQNLESCILWQQQLQFTIIHHLTYIKTLLMSIIYALIALNIMGMISLLTTPYEWMTQL